MMREPYVLRISNAPTTSNVGPSVPFANEKRGREGFCCCFTGRCVDFVVDCLKCVDFVVDCLKCVDFVDCLKGGR